MLRLFISKGCAECHSGINLGGNMYAPFGILERPDADLLPRSDTGRFMAASQIGAPVSATEAGQIAAFLGSLTGEQPRITYPILPPSVAAAPTASEP